MNRRNFLQSMFAAAMAPTICKAENLMKIYVPNRDIQIINSFGADSMKFDGCGDYIPFSDNPNDYVFGDKDFTIETISNKNGQFIFLAVTRKNNIIKCYSDGILTEETQAHKELMTAKKNIDQDDSIWSLYSNNTELRLTEGVAREEANMLFARK
jgi:hypothetical protein